MTLLGVLSDTHIPDRARSLDPRILSVFEEKHVDAILHAGDIAVASVLAGLEKIAPVYAVRGNRDWVALRHLPLEQRLTFDGVKIVMAHGHGRWWNYVSDRLRYLLVGYRQEMFIPRLLEAYPDVDVIVFGHTHRSVNRMFGRQLVFNPGSPQFPEDHTAPSVGLLHINSENVWGEIVQFT